MNKQRAEFEAWCQERFGQVPLWDYENDQYLLSSARLRFEAYQAALASPEAKALRKDAKRYRFLATHCQSMPKNWGGSWLIVVDGPCPASHDSEDDFDAAIDAAMEKQK